MKPKKTEKKKFEKTVLFFLQLSLLFHLLILLISLIQPQFLFFLPKHKTKTKEIPAALKPRKSNFGTTVLFDNRAQFKPTTSKMTTNQQQKLKQPGVKPKKPKKKIVPPKKEIKKTKPEKKVIIAKQETPKPRPLDAIYSVPKSTQKSLRANGEKKEKAKRRSIIAMTNGFIENLKNKGNDWLERKGDENKRQSFAELKYLSYEQKINWHLQKAWKINCEKQAINSGKVIINFSIDAEGNVERINLRQSSGYKNLDELVIKTVELAAPFPPLPKHFGKEIYHTGRIINVAPSNFVF